MYGIITLVPRDRHKMKQKWNSFLKEINSFLLNFTDVSFLQLPVRGRSCHPEHYTCVYKTWKRGTKLPSSLQQESWKTFSIPSVPSPFAPLSSPGRRVCPHLCWDNLLEYPDFPSLICLKETNGYYYGQIHPKPELSVFGIPTNRAHPKRDSAKSNTRLHNYYLKGHEA